MAELKWLPAKDVAARYGTGEKWPWYQQKMTPTFHEASGFLTA